MLRTYLRYFIGTNEVAISLLPDLATTKVSCDAYRTCSMCLHAKDEIFWVLVCKLLRRFAYMCL